MSGTVTVPGVSSNISLSFTGTANLGLANQIANALAQASADSTLTTVDYDGGSSIPVLPSGSTEELVLSPTVSGSITVPAAASGVTEVLVIQNNLPITIHGSPGLEIIGDGANVTIIDPAIIDLGDNGSTTNTDSVTVTQANSPYIVTMRTGTESVFASGSGTIFGGSKTDLIDLANAGFGTSNVVVTEGSDTVYGGDGAATVTNQSTATNSLDVGGNGSFIVNDLGIGDTIAADSKVVDDGNPCHQRAASWLQWTDVVTVAAGPR